MLPLYRSVIFDHDTIHQLPVPLLDSSHVIETVEVTQVVHSFLLSPKIDLGHRLSIKIVCILLGAFIHWNSRRSAVMDEDVLKLVGKNTIWDLWL